MATYNLTANGSTPGERKAAFFSASVEEVIVAVGGTFGGGNITIEFSADGGMTWVADGTLAAQDTAFGGSFKTHAGLLYRATLAGATTPSIDVTFLS